MPTLLFTEAAPRSIPSAVLPKDHVGDIIRKARRAKGWSHERLGEEAKKFTFPGSDEVERINKSTVSLVERDPYSRKVSTLWRLLAALGLSFADIEQRIGTPIDAFQAKEADAERPASDPFRSSRPAASHQRMRRRSRR